MLLLSSSLRIIGLICLTILTTKCGTGKDDYDSNTYAPPAELQIDSELQPYLDSYLADSEAAGVPVPEKKVQELKGLMWTDRVNLQSAPNASALGVCQRRPGLRYVEILRPNAAGKVGSMTMDEITLKVMVYHELGHCLHDFSGHTDGKSASVMNAYLQPARYFDAEGLLMDHFRMLKKMQDDPSFRPNAH